MSEMSFREKLARQSLRERLVVASLHHEDVDCVTSRLGLIDLLVDTLMEKRDFKEIEGEANVTLEGIHDQLEAIKETLQEIAWPTNGR